jgi:hypothetical protein
MRGVQNESACNDSSRPCCARVRRTELDTLIDLHVRGHNRLIRDAARRTLAPLGLRQRGRSRTWVDDHGWWLIVVEFQPSSWARGTYLNVGAMWLWRAIDHLAFEFGGRVGEFLDVDGSTDIAAEIDRVASEVRRLRKALATPLDASRELARKPGAAGWDFLHAATAACVAGQSDMAQRILARVETPKPGAPEWQRRFWQEVSRLQAELGDPVALNVRLSAAIKQTRAVLKLPDCDVSLPS